MALADPEREHPLLSDPIRLERILTLVYIKIQKVLFDRKGPPRGRGRSEPSILGGVSAEDVLQDAFEAMLKHATMQREDLSNKWVPLAIRIGANKAIDALRAASKGLRGTEHRPKLEVVSADSPAPGTEGSEGATILDRSPDPNSDPEEEALAICRVQQLWELAQALLDERELWIYVEIKHKGRTRREVGKELGLKGQRISQIYEEMTRRLQKHPKYPYTNE